MIQSLPWLCWMQVMLRTAVGETPTAMANSFFSGLVTQMSATGRKNLHRLLYDVFTGDGKLHCHAVCRCFRFTHCHPPFPGANAAKMFLSLSSTKCKEPEQFTTAMKQLFLKRVGAPRTKAEIAHDVMSTAVDALPLPSSLRNAFQTVLHAAEKDESNGDGMCFLHAAKPILTGAVCLLCGIFMPLQECSKFVFVEELMLES